MKLQILLILVIFSLVSSKYLKPKPENVKINKKIIEKEDSNMNTIYEKETLTFNMNENEYHLKEHLIDDMTIDNKEVKSITYYLDKSEILTAIHPTSLLPVFKRVNNIKSVEKEKEKKKEEEEKKLKLRYNSVIKRTNMNQSNNKNIEIKDEKSINILYIDDQDIYVNGLIAFLKHNNYARFTLDVVQEPTILENLMKTNKYKIILFDENIEGFTGTIEREKLIKKYSLSKEYQKCMVTFSTHYEGDNIKITKPIKKSDEAAKPIFNNCLGNK